MSEDDGRFRRGYYADPSSPIASTPQRKRTGPRTAASGPSAPLSPLHGPAEKPLARRESTGDSSTWTTALFSPVLKFFNGEEGEEPEGYEAEGSGAGGGAAAEASVPAGHGATPDRLPAAAVMSPHAPGAPPRGAAGGAGGGGAGVGAAVAASAASLSRGVPVTPEHEPIDTTAGSAGGHSAVTPTVDTSAPADEEDNYYEFEEFNPYLFIKLLPPYAAVAPPRPHIVLPAKARDAPRISLVLDLDETLVHCSVDPIPDADLTFPVEFNGAQYVVYVRKRPYLDRFLEAVHDKYEVTVFTASQQVYASRLLDLLDPRKMYIKYRLYRDSCLNVDGNYLKDLNVLGRDLRQTVLVDNSPHAFGYQINNGIPIESWFDDPSDTELLKLVSFLHTLHDAPDVRPLLHRRFNMQALVENSMVDGMGPGPRTPGTL